MPHALAGPVREAERIESLDVARGLALLGIFMVNIQMMAQPLGWYVLGGGSNEGPLGSACYYLTRVFCESKSYPLFSMLFGMGLALMHDRAGAAGRPFTPRYLRRLAMLLLMGVAHAVLLWYGDVLVYYALVGFAVMWLARCRPRTLLAIGVVLTVLAALWAGGLQALMTLGGGPPKAAPTDVTTFAEFWARLTSGGGTTGPFDPAWTAAEIDAFAHGPFAHEFKMRTLDWASTALFWIIANGGVVHIAAMFCVGAAIMRAGVMTDPRPLWTRRFLLLGVLVGLPVAVLAVALHALAPASPLAVGGGTALTMLAGPCLSLGYLGGAMWLARRCGGAAPVRAIAAAGRTALTNYIAQSLVAAAVMMHWGLAMFGEFTQAQMVALVLTVYAVQLAASALWLRACTMGPLEWVWRCWTYLRFSPFVRRRTRAG